MFKIPKSPPSEILNEPSWPGGFLDSAGPVPSDVTKNARRRHLQQTGDDLLKAAERAMTQKAIELGLAGDTVMLRYCLNRISSQDMRAAAFTLPEIKEVADLAEATSAVVKAMVDRTISTEEGVHYARLVSLHASVMRDADMSARLADLEGRQVR